MPLTHDIKTTTSNIKTTVQEENILVMVNIRKKILI